ncbi:mitotic checkpoint serine/threonine-protein kinase BUB1 [Antennarius striatus]|uniref:mitotic checkpoint serine/threonine-protein kinase BUB1 n=1 Tax=Antennarius striatus TaxID=241820 RepID=UPI0035AFB5F2
MDIASCLQCFESKLSSYSGDDPLEPWDRLVSYLEQTLPADGGGGMLLVLENLVRRFVGVERYADDPRFVSYCIRCASYSPDPIALFSFLHGKGVGARTAALYVAWAEHLEKRGRGDQAEAVFQRALENQVQPVEAVLSAHRQFRTRSRGAGARPPLQSSHLTNQTPSHTEPAAPSKEAPPKPAAVRTVITVSRSETSGSGAGPPGVPTAPAYETEALACDGSELSFEEVRAEKFFSDRRRREELERREQVRQQEEHIRVLMQRLEEINLELCGGGASRTPAQLTETDPTQQPLGHPGPSHRPNSRRSLGLRLHPDPTPDRSDPEPDDRLDTSQGPTLNPSHVTPNTSLGFTQATPSKALPSPTVNTLEALDVIMDMFQAPTLLDDPFPSVLHAPLGAEPEPRPAGNGGSSPFARAPPTLFTIFQDDADEENRVPAPSLVKAQPIRALAEIQAPSKPNDAHSDLIPDESTLWGGRYNPLNSLAACPNSTTDFALLARFVSTPSAHGGNFYQDKENLADGREGEDDAFVRRQSKKLSPILEQSPSNESLCGSGVAPLAVVSSDRLGTIVSERLCLTSSSLTLVQPPPPAALSFRDQTVGPAESSGPPRAAQESEGPPQPPLVPTSPDCVPKPDWLNIRSPEASGPDLDAFLSPRLSEDGHAPQDRNQDVPMSPEQPPLCEDVPMTPGRPRLHDDVPMTPGWPPLCDDVPMSPDQPPQDETAPRSDAGRLVSDPWDDALIAALLASLSPPLTSDPRCVTWACDVPPISPKMTISLGGASLRVDGVVGEGAFATVFQATDLLTSEKLALKVQRPANPWEFYIHTQLDARLSPAERCLFSGVRAAHLFQDGSVLLGELHGYGTLLNAVNLYKTQSDRLMPAPLVLHLSVCILDTVERLHRARLLHADIKPDNFLLGERFLEHRCLEAGGLEPGGLEPGGLDHGLVLIDLGQSIDMNLFPEGTAFTARCLTSGFQCTEMLSGKPWSYQTDYFGIAGTVHCLLFGTYMEVRKDGDAWRTNGVFRRNPHADLWQEFFHVLLNVPAGGPPPSLGGLRRKLGAVLQQNYGNKLATLKRRLVVMLLENRKAGRR